MAKRLRERRNLGAQVRSLQERNDWQARQMCAMANRLVTEAGRVLVWEVRVSMGTDEPPHRSLWVRGENLSAVLKKITTDAGEEITHVSRVGRVDA